MAKIETEFELPIKKRGRWWVTDFYDNNGNRIRKKLSPYKDVAERMCRELLAVRDAERNGIMPKDGSLFAFKEKYFPFRKAKVDPSTYYNDVRAFEFAETYGRPIIQLSQMTPEYLDDLWIKAKTHKTHPLTDRTISGHIRRIKTAMHQARRWGMAPMQDWGIVKCLADNKRTEYLSLPEFQKVLESCEGRFQRAAMLMGWGGLRRGEVLHLEWSDVDFKNHIIKIQAKADWAPKGSKPGAPKNRVVDMTSKLEAYLKALPDRSGLVLGGSPINEDVFSEYFRELGRKLGIKVFPHKFRHTCGSFLISTGATPDMIGALFGQSDPRSTKVYTHMMPHARRNAVDQMERGMDQLGAQNA